MDNLADQLTQRLARLVELGRSQEFEQLAFQLIRTKLPTLQLTEPSNDGGADGVTLRLAADETAGVRLAVSFTATLDKVRKDCRSLRDSGDEIEQVIFVTPKPVQKRTADNWRKTIRAEFGWDLEVLARSAVVAELERPEHAWLGQKYLGIDRERGVDLDAVASRARAEALERLARIREAYGLLDSALVPWFLEVPDDAEQEPSSTSFDELLTRLQDGGRAIVLGAPGLGKTACLVALAERVMSESDSAVAVFVPIGDWTAEPQSFSGFAASELQVTEAELNALADAGRLTWVLDGWNEIGAAQLPSAEAHLRALERRSPGRAIVASTRGRGAMPRLAGSRRLEMRPLSDADRRKFVRMSGLPGSADLIREIESRPELDDLTRTPLFLAAAIAIVRSGAKLPSTQFEVLGAFVESVDRHRRAELRVACSGQHHFFLADLAKYMLTRGLTRVRVEDACSQLAATAEGLAGNGILRDRPEPLAVLEALIAHHLLVGAAGHLSTVGFAHHRLQEWFGAAAVYPSLVRVDKAAVDRVQTEVLNRPVWESSVLIVMERLRVEGRHDDAARLIRWSLPIDLSLVASLARVAGDEAWNAVADEVSGPLLSIAEDEDPLVSEFGLKLLARSGQESFAPVFVSRLGAKDRETRLQAGDALGAHGLAVLGEHLAPALMNMDAGDRAEFIDWVGISAPSTVARALVSVAGGDESPLVRATLLRLKMWHGWFDEAKTALMSSPPAIVNQPGIAEELGYFPARCTSELTAWLLEALEAVESEDVRVAVLPVLASTGSHDAIDELKAHLRLEQDPRLVEAVLSEIRESDPHWVSEWLSERLKAEARWDDRWSDDLKLLGAEDHDALAGFALEAETSPRRGQQILRVLASVNPSVVGERLSMRLAEWMVEKGDVFSDVPARLSDLDFSVRVEAAVRCSRTPADPSQLDLLLRCASSRLSNRAGRLVVPDGLRMEARQRILEWYDLTARWPDAAPSLRGSLAMVLGAVGDESDVATIRSWIESDMQDRRRVLEETDRPRTLSVANLFVTALTELRSKEAVSALAELLSQPGYLGHASSALADLAVGPDLFFSWTRSPGESSPATDEPPLSYTQASSAERVADALSQAFGADPATTYDFEIQLALKALVRLNPDLAYPLVPAASRLVRNQSTISTALQPAILAGIILPDSVAEPLAEELLTQVSSGEVWFHDPVYELLEGLSLLVNSSRPELAIDYHRRLRPRLGRSHRARDSIERLAAAASARVVDYMLGLLTESEYEPWIETILRNVASNPSHSATTHMLRLFDELDESVPGELDRSLGEAMKCRVEVDPGFLSELVNRATGGLGNNQRQVLATLLWRLEGEDAAALAVELLDDGGAEIPHAVNAAIESAFVKKEPVDGWGSAFRLVPKSCQPIRVRLFEVFLNRPRASEGARRVLLRLEARREDYGRPTDEPRHPDWNEHRDPSAPWLCLMPFAQETGADQGS